MSTTPPRCAFVTFGCKINSYDTQALRESILELGFREAPLAEGVDLVLVNSCTVTNTAGQKSVAAVRRLARRNPDAMVIVTGCMTEADRAALRAIPRVAHVVGNEEKDQIPALIMGGARVPTRGRRSRSIFRLRASHFTGRTRAFLKVHDGCDSFCSYCIIPFLRGKSHSRDPEDVLAEARRFAEAGHRELVLTGIHLSQFGRDLPGGYRLVTLLRALRSIPGIDRVRLSSIGEGAFSDEFVELFRTDPGCCPFFHIPLQSGSDSVLARMRRDYTVSEYLSTVDRIRERLPRSVVATDLMVGFPGETEREFEESLAVCRRVGFAKIHLFPYSPRGGTRAARMEGQVPALLREERMARARALEAELAAAERRRRIGARVEVLVETEDAGAASGLSREGLTVRFRRGDDGALWNREIPVLLTGEVDGTLAGEIADDGPARRAR